jgi:hypothetical protein
MAQDQRLMDRARRVDAALAVLRRHAAARERQRKPVPAELREAIAEFGSELGSVRKQLDGDRRRPKTGRA